MIIKQLTIFIENRAGRLLDVTKTLADADINLSALSLADTSEFGLLRLVVSDPDKALQILKEKGFSVKLTDVICLVTNNKAGELSKALESLSDADISIEYMYAFSKGEKSFIVIKCDDSNKAIEVLKNKNMELMKDEEIYNI